MRSSSGRDFPMAFFVGGGCLSRSSDETLNLHQVLSASTRQTATHSYLNHIGLERGWYIFIYMNDWPLIYVPTHLRLKRTNYSLSGQIWKPLSSIRIMGMETIPCHFRNFWSWWCSGFPPKKMLYLNSYVYIYMCFSNISFPGRKHCDVLSPLPFKTAKSLNVF